METLLNTVDDVEKLYVDVMSQYKADDGFNLMCMQYKGLMIQSCCIRGAMIGSFYHIVNIFLGRLIQHSKDRFGHEWKLFIWNSDIMLDSFILNSMED